MHIFDGLGNDVNLTQINLPENVDSICGCAFWGCRSLTSIKIPSNVKTLGNNTFENCSSLRRITLPSNLIYIESAPFNGCTSLDSLNIPSTVKEIEYSSFDGCTGLKDLFCYPETPPTVISNGFSSDVTSVCKLHVPSNVLSLYKQDYYWSKFYNISGDLQSTGISAINSDCNVVKTEYYSLDGKLMDDAAKGPMLERQYLSNGKVVSRKIVK